MESYKNIGNKLIKNGKRMLKQKVLKPFDVQLSGSPISKTITTRIETLYDDLSNLFIEVDWTFNAAITAVNQFNSVNIFKRIILRQRSTGIELCNIDNVYQMYRVQQLEGQDIEKYIKAGNFQITGAGTSGKTITPVFGFFSEFRNSTIPTATMDELELFCEFNTSLVAMGFTTAGVATSTSIKLRSLFLNNTKTDVPKSLVNSYNIYYETCKTITTSGANETGEYRMQLRCPFPCFNVIAMFLQEGTANYGQINSIKLITNNNEFVDSSIETNYSLFDPVNYYNKKYAFAHWFVDEKNRTSYDGLLCFSSSMNQTDILINYTSDAAVGNYCLFVFYEYKTEHKIVDGRIQADTSIEGSTIYQ